jgi:hypothetical protein
MLVLRMGNRLYWRDGKVVDDGFVGLLFTAQLGGAATTDLASVLGTGNTTGGLDILFTAGGSLRMARGGTPAGLALSGTFFVSDGTGGLIVGEPYYRDESGTPQRVLGGGLATRTLATNEFCDGVTSSIQIGQFAFNPNSYGSGKTFQFEVILSVNIGTLTATASLYNLTDGETVTGTSLTTSNTTPTKRNSGDLTVGSASGRLKDSEKIYEVHLENSGTLVTDLSNLGSSIIIISG